MEYDVIHQQNKQRFVISINKHDAVIEYKLEGNIIDFTRTFVPEELRGEGIAGKLVRAALTWAKSQHFEMTSSCWYVQKFL